MLIKIDDDDQTRRKYTFPHLFHAYDVVVMCFSGVYIFQKALISSLPILPHR